MGTRRRRGVFQFKIDCEQNGGGGGAGGGGGGDPEEDWNIAFRTERKVERFFAQLRRKRSLQSPPPPESADIDTRTFIKEGFTSPYAESVFVRLTLQPQLPPPPPPSRPASITNTLPNPDTPRTLGSPQRELIQKRSAIHSTQPIRNSVGSAIPKTSLPGRIPITKSSAQKAEFVCSGGGGGGSPFKIVPRPVLQTPPIAISSSDDESLPGVTTITNPAAGKVIYESMNEKQTASKAGQVQPISAPDRFKIRKKSHRNPNTLPAAPPPPAHEQPSNQSSDSSQLADDNIAPPNTAASSPQPARPQTPPPSPPPPSPPPSPPENTTLRPPSRSNKQPLGAKGGANSVEIDLSESESEITTQSPVVEIEPGIEADNLIRATFAKTERMEIRSKRPSPGFSATSPKPLEKKARHSFNGIPTKQVLETVIGRYIPPQAQVLSYEDHSLNDDYASMMNMSSSETATLLPDRPLKRYDLPGGVMFYEDDALEDLGLVSIDKRTRLFPMFGKNSILYPSGYIAPLDNTGAEILKHAQTHSSELYCMIRRRKITIELFNHVILLHHASEAFYLTLDLVTARMLQNCEKRRQKPPNMKDKKVQVFPACTECSSFIAVFNHNGQDQAFCLFCDMQYPNITRDNGIQAIENSSTLQPYIPPGGYIATDADLNVAGIWLEAIKKHPGPILSLLFTVFAVLPPGWGNCMLRQIAEKGPDLKLCGFCGLGSIIGHQWHDEFRCTWCMGTRSKTHLRNSKSPDRLLYHIEFACKAYKLIEGDNSQHPGPPIMAGNQTGETSTDQEPYLTPINEPQDYYPQGRSTLGAPHDIDAYHSAELISGSNNLYAPLNLNAESSLMGGAEVHPYAQSMPCPMTGVMSFEQDGPGDGGGGGGHQSGLAAAGMTSMMFHQPVGASTEEQPLVQEYEDPYCTHAIEPPNLQRCDATSPASTSPRCAPCFPYERPGWGLADGRGSAIEAIDKMTDSLIAKITTTTASEEEAARARQPPLGARGDLEVDYNASEE